METSGAECELGGGGSGGDDGGGGDGGGTGGGDVLPGFPSNNPVQVGGAYQEMTTLALSYINDTLRVGMTNLSGKGASVAAYSHDINMKMYDLVNIAKATNNGMGGIEESTRHQTDAIWGVKATLQQLTNCVVNPKENNCEHLGGSADTDGPITETDILDIKNALWASNIILGGVNSNVGSINGNIDYLNRKMAWDVDAIKGMMQNNQGSGGGSGGEGGPGIDYSQMPGSSQNPLHVAGADYESKLCQGDVKCAFDLGTINQRYEEQKEALKSQYLAIKDEMADIFKYQFSGSASVPKCFDMFSIFGKDYQVCPDSDGYWDFLAALMMFIFYFAAFMILTKR
ncbi:hypothetical protein N5D88_10890 [Aeromonas caviae]|uniref:hypothetical protein n=1 Tax=Aeromonas caviae TaxID=648 RepID=UPI002449C40A|nr:hypothetical protein [Aeromonas caviae]MDH1840930.1 hypothetical protein [Aeromonas caviae]